MTSFDVDPPSLARELEALPLGYWIEATNDLGTFRLVRVPGGWYLPGDLTISSGDVADGHPSHVEVLGDLFGEDPGDFVE